MTAQAPFVLPDLIVLRVETSDDRDDFLTRLREVSRGLEVPVQALRTDRVLSPVHIGMAATHARRAQDDARARAADPAVEFLLYAAGDRQIHRAVEALGLPDGPVGEAVVVFLGPVDPDHAQQALAPWRVTPMMGPWEADAAAAWWRDRLDAAGAVEDALLARMALLALDKA